MKLTGLVLRPSQRFSNAKRNQPTAPNPEGGKAVLWALQVDCFTEQAAETTEFGVSDC